MDKGSCVMDKRSSMAENRCCVVNKRGSFNKRSSIVEAIVVSVWKAIVIPKRVRVSNQRVIINKGAVSLTMSSNTAVVVSIGISLGISISISISFGFSLTALTSKVHKGGYFMTMVHNRDRVHLMRHNSWCFNNRLHNWSMSNSMS